MSKAKGEVLGILGGADDHREENENSSLHEKIEV